MLPTLAGIALALVGLLLGDLASPDGQQWWLVAAGLAIAVCEQAARVLLPTGRWLLRALRTLVEAFPADDDARNGGQLIADVLRGHGVKHIFTLCGGHISTVLVGCKAKGIAVVDTRHEATAVFAADAMYRLTGVVGAAAVTAGPGVTNTVTAVKNAQMAQSAVIIVGGAATTVTQGRGALQDVEQLAIFRPVTKWATSVRCTGDLQPTLQRALHVAREGVPGPVFVEVPIDLLYPFAMVSAEYYGKSEPRSLQQKLVRRYLSYRLALTFSGGLDSHPRLCAPLPVRPLPPSGREVAKTAERLSRATKPVLLLASQAVDGGPERAKRLAAVVDRLGIPCYLQGMARGALGARHPLLLRHKKMDCTKEADFILLGGVVCDFRLNYGRSLSSKAYKCAVNRDRTGLHMNSDIVPRDLSIHADVLTFLEALADHMEAEAAVGAKGTGKAKLLSSGRE